MRQKIRSGVNYFIAIIFVMLGVIGILIPVMPQAIFFAIALIILSFEIPAVNDHINSRINPETYFGKTYLKTRQKLEKFFS